MFETPKEIKPSASKGMWTGIAVVAVLIAVGAYFYINHKGTSNKQTATAAAVPAPPAGDADAVRDLKIQRATMDKDRTGTTAIWVVSIENKSATYSYSNIQYETTYVGANNNAILVNKGTIATTIPPGEQQKSQVNDALYPAGTAWYKIRITGATPAVATPNPF
jgi:hypothetical protein